MWYLSPSCIYSLHFILILYHRPGGNVKFFFVFYLVWFLQAAFSSVVGYFGMFVAGAGDLSIGERVVGGWSSSERH